MCHFQEEALRTRYNPHLSFSSQVPDGNCFISLALSEDHIWVRSKPRKEDTGKRGVEESLLKGPSTKVWAGLAETRKGWRDLAGL